MSETGTSETGTSETATVPPEFPLLRARTQNFRAGVPRNLTLAVDGSSLLFLRSDSGTDPVNHLWQLQPGAADPVVRKIVDAGKLGSDGEAETETEAERARRERLRESAAGITDFSTDELHQRVCFTVSGVLWLHDLASGRTRSVAGDGAAAALLSPDGSRIAFSREGSLVVVGVDGPEGSEDVLCRPSTPEETWGLADFIAAEEMGRFSGMWWSPDGNRLLATLVDESPVSQWWISDPANPDRAPRQVRYPAAGTANADVRLFLIELDGARREVSWDRSAWPYLARVRWDTGFRPLVQVQSRDQLEVASLAVDPDTGTAGLRATRRQRPWIELIPGAPRLTAGGLIDVAVDPQTDTRRLVRQPGTAGGEPVPEEFLTPPGLQVRAVVGADDHGVAVLAVSERVEQGLYQVGWDGELKRLDEPGGWSSGSYRAGGQVVSRADPLEPASRVTVTVAGRTHVIPSVGADPGLRPRPEYLAVAATGVDTAVLWPGGVRPEPGARLPIIMSPYGGPHGQRVLRAAAAYLTEQWIADQGFCVVVADGPGSPGTPAEEQSIAGDLAAGALAGQVRALERVTAEFGDLVDPGRVGIRGWSFGGYLSALAVLERPDVFHAAVAGAPVTYWEGYDTHYTERYLGLPSENPEGYSRSGLLGRAHKLRRPLLLVHGLNDDNVFAAHTLRLSAALLAAGRPHTVLPLSGVSHMTPQETVAENLLRLDVDFLRRSLRVRGESRPSGQRFTR